MPGNCAFKQGQHDPVCTDGRLVRDLEAEFKYSSPCMKHRCAAGVERLQSYVCAEDSNLVSSGSMLDCSGSNILLKSEG